MDEQKELSEPSSQKTYGCHGAAFGGCLLPTILLFLAAASGDIGGPLFWPILAAFLGLIGMTVGLFVRRRFKSEICHGTRTKDGGEQNGDGQSDTAPS